jgi:acetyltransferase
MLGQVNGPMYHMAISTLLKDRNVDIVLPILVPHVLIDSNEIAQSIVDAARGAKKPVLPCFMGDISVGEARVTLQGNYLPMYVYPETAALVLKNMLRYDAWRRQPVFTVQTMDHTNAGVAQKLLAAAGEADSLGEAATRPLLEAYGIPVVKGGFATNAREAAKLMDTIGGPVVMKIVSPQILHKSDVGGIRLNLADPAAVHSEYEELMTHLHEVRPEAELEGVLIEKMAPRGQEVIIGMKRDPGFGPLLMFGLGGIYVELFKDVSFRVAPLTAAEARQMITETSAGRLLTGFRGAPSADLDAVVDVILRLSQLALDFPQIREIEVNPLLVYPEGQGVLALDGRVILR